MSDEIPAQLVNARLVFRVGDRVQYSEYAYARGLVKRDTKRPTTGVVRGFGSSEYSVRVQLTGQKTVSKYSAAFWERPHD